MAHCNNLLQRFFYNFKERHTQSLLKNTQFLPKTPNSWQKIPTSFQIIPNSWQRIPNSCQKDTIIAKNIQLLPNNS